MACGVGAAGNKCLVALLTPTSVACAESSTAISSSKVELYSNSVVGFGLLARRRSNISTRFCLFMIHIIVTSRGRESLVSPVFLRVLDGSYLTSFYRQ